MVQTDRVQTALILTVLVLTVLVLTVMVLTVLVPTRPRPNLDPTPASEKQKKCFYSYVYLSMS